ncbi:MAG: hypothetical protein PHE99_05295 [Bacteroidales bacterium]|nr:hypothetical protein [Bacteroidales bacterium]
MKWFEAIGRGPFNYQREVLRRPRKTTMVTASGSENLNEKTAVKQSLGSFSVLG